VLRSMEITQIPIQMLKLIFGWAPQTY